jgi:oxygen-dependent protoporphyrinogen oxidase
MTTALVVGSGISGLAAAWCLADEGLAVHVVERGAAPGGLIGTRETPYGRVERAANAFVWTDTTARWFATLGLEPEFAEDTSRRKYIFRGRPRRWPLTVTETAAMGARFGVRWLARRNRPRDGESVAAFSDRVLGQAATSWLVGPALQGIYGAPPHALAAQAVFSGEPRPRGRRLAAPPGGMGTFVMRLYERLRARGVSFEFNRTIGALDSRTPTVICTNARDAARLLVTDAPQLSDALGSITMTSMVSATAFYPTDARDLSGFGVLFPRGGGVQALGVLFNSQIFCSRCAWRSETWIYGASEDHRLDSDAGTADVVCEDREHLTGARAQPIEIYVTRHTQALPVYGSAILDVRSRVEDLPDWLALAGNATGRLGIARLLDVAEAAAVRISASTERSRASA